MRVGSTVTMVALLGLLTNITVTSADRLDNFNFWHGKLGLPFGTKFSTEATNCNDVDSETKYDQDDSNQLCLLWKEKVRLKIKRRANVDDDIDCTDVFWEAMDCTVDIFEDCLNMLGSHWYGGTTVRRLRWPVENWTIRYQPYVTGDAYPVAPEEFGGVQERYWVTSNGTAYYVDWETPLWVSVNALGSGQLCFKAQYNNSPYNNYNDSPLRLNYTVCQGNNVRHIHDYMTNTYFSKPTDIPDELLFKYPIWSTWAQYKQDVTQEKVLDFADTINSNGFSNSQIEIDDKWEKFYGDMDFDLEKFPDPKAMIAELSEKGFRTTIWVHPFVNLDSPALSEGLQRVAFVADTGAVIPAVTRWWCGPNAMKIDFTGVRGRLWFNARLQALQTNYNISSFKFDAGETNWLPNCFRLAEQSRNPNTYTARYAETAFALDTNVRHQEVRVGTRTQHLPVFVRMMDKDSSWGYINGIETLISHTLQFGLLGYPFVLPDMVGGNGYSVLPDRELFIRWVELNAFLPSIQFSIAPWQFDSEVLAISRNMSKLHEEYAQRMIDLAREATVTGAPIIRPLWWIAPLDPVAQTIDSEFLVGDNLLVAPVVIQNARSRDIYLPNGDWHDELRDVDIIGGGWLRDYPVALNELAYFTKIVE